MGVAQEFTMNNEVERFFNADLVLVCTAKWLKPPEKPM